jgi:hypothetical protein
VRILSTDKGTKQGTAKDSRRKYPNGQRSPESAVLKKSDVESPTRGPPSARIAANPSYDPAPLCGLRDIGLPSRIGESAVARKTQDWVSTGGWDDIGTTQRLGSMCAGARADASA